MLEIKGKYATATIMIDDVEESALKQIYNIVNSITVKGCKIVVMPDVHAGKGNAVVGMTIELGEKLSPSWIGVDIGCSVISVNIGKNFPKNKDELLKIDKKIRNVMPTGNNIMDSVDVPSKFFENNFNWKLTNDQLLKFIVNYNKKFNTNYKPIEYDYKWFLNKCHSIGMLQNAEMGIGTLGSGNHYCEVGLSSITGDYWLTVHTGSRNFGKMICNYHMKIARNNLDYKRNVILKNKIEEIKNKYSRNDIHKKINEAKKDLNIDFEINMNGMEYLEGQYAIDYFVDMIFAQSYAKFNRETIINRILNELSLKENDRIDSTHNYINFEDMIIRKGAITSYVGQKMLIPLSMKDGMLICEGKSNSDWNFSANHGAGRIMSRGKANELLDLQTFKKDMIGIVSTSVCKSTLDESPRVYKNPKIIESAIEPTAIIVDRIKPVLNIKSSENENFREMRKKEKEKKRHIGEDDDDLISNKDFRKDRRKLRVIRGKF
jgi:RNA-splicing ligase RtcB